jgi:hypothetical protein
MSLCVWRSTFGFGAVRRSPDMDVFRASVSDIGAGCSSRERGINGRQRRGAKAKAGYLVSVISQSSSSPSSLEIFREQLQNRAGSRTFSVWRWRWLKVAASAAIDLSPVRARFRGAKRTRNAKRSTPPSMAPSRLWAWIQFGLSIVERWLLPATAGTSSKLVKSVNDGSSKLESLRAPSCRINRCS